MKKIIVFISILFLVSITYGQSNEELSSNYLSFKPGTLVKAVSGTTTFDYTLLEKTTIAYDNEVLGIIKPDLKYGDPRFFMIPISTGGTVRVICNNSNGDIKKGDPITTSTIPGEGMKATQSGMIIGVALEDAPLATGLIEVRVLIQYVVFPE